jgi:hypothetical protein
LNGLVGALSGPKQQHLLIEGNKMSTSYRPLKEISALDLFDGRLEDLGIREHIAENTTEGSRCLTDGRNYMWVYVDREGKVSDLVRYAPNVAPGKILNAVRQLFDTDIVSEYEPQYWGFDTEEEWDAFQAKISKQHKDEFYVDIMKFLRGEPHNISPGTNGMTMAKIAKTLVEKDPSLLNPENKEKLLAKVDEVFLGEHVVRVELTPEDIARAEMMVTHEDDLPQA